MEINKDLIAASSTPIVLAILAEEDSYGYAILQRVRAFSGGPVEGSERVLPTVLAILAEEDSYGYAILQRVRALSGGRMEWTDGMLYPVLHRLERLGHVEGGREGG